MKGKFPFFRRNIYLPSPYVKTSCIIRKRYICVYFKVFRCFAIQVVNVYSKFNWFIPKLFFLKKVGCIHMSY